MIERALSLAEAAEHMGWSRRTLTRALARHGMATIGTGRRARLEPGDLDDEQTKHLIVTLGDIRRAELALRKLEAIRTSPNWKPSRRKA